MQNTPPRPRPHLKVHDIFKNISEEDMVTLGLNPQYSRPDWLIITVLPVPPPHVRPSVALDAGARSEDDLTHQLVSRTASTSGVHVLNPRSHWRGARGYS